MEIAALASFIVLIVSWMALPASGFESTERKAPAIRTEMVGAEA